MLKIILVSLMLLFSGNILFAAPPEPAAPEAKEVIRIVSPAENTDVLGKKPDIKVEFTESTNRGTLFVTLDGVDITPLLSVTDKGFEFKPLSVMAAGPHNLSIAVMDAKGVQQQKNASFKIRHYEHVEEAYSNNMASVIGETVLFKPESYTTTPYAKVEGNLKSETKLKSAGWEFMMSGNVRYLDQNAPVQSPLEKGLDLANWIITGGYTKDLFKAQASVGDVQVNETPYTISNLNRKGGIFNLDYDMFKIKTFTLRSQQEFGQRGSIFGKSADDSISGISAGVQLFEKKMEFKTIYITGGDPSTNSATTAAVQPGTFGTTTTAGQKEGSVLGFLLTSNFFENMLKTEFEAAFSNYDPDTSDEFDKRQDHAYKIKLDGILGRYSYLAQYELIGKDFGTVGNQAAEKDKQRIIWGNGLNLDAHLFNLTLLRMNDNVTNDSLFARTVNYNGNLAYTFSKIQGLPLGVNYVKDLQKSADEPVGFTPIDRDTDSVTGWINYAKDQWGLGFSTMYSLMDDRTPANADTKSITYTLTPAFNAPGFSVGSSLSLNQSYVQTTDVRTDTYMIALNLNKSFFSNRLVFNMAESYSIAKANDDSSNIKTLNVTSTLTYKLRDHIKGLVDMDPAIALRSGYIKVVDGVNVDADKDEFTLFLVFTTAIPFSF